MTDRADHQLWIDPEYTPDEAEYVDYDPRHDLAFTVECPGLAEGQCTLWLECTDGEHSSFEDAEWTDTEFHGVEHQIINGSWMVETNQCLIQWAVHQNGDSAPWDVAHDVQHVPGAYAVDAEWEGEWVRMDLSGEPVSL